MYPEHSFIFRKNEIGFIFLGKRSRKEPNVNIAGISQAATVAKSRNRKILDSPLCGNDSSQLRPMP
jgi:hypothetical protein